MKTANPGARKQKIFLFYALAVVLPGILLGYMAYRGIRNDQALREKENYRKLEMYSQDFFTAIDSGFVQFLNEQTTDSMLYGARQYDPALLALIVKDSSGSQKIITHQLLYLPAEFLAKQTEQFKQPASLKEGLRLEYNEQRFSDALRFYQDIVLKTNDPAEKIRAMVSSARLYNKLNQPDRAKALYDEIRKDYPGRLLNGQIPLGLLASLEILKINIAGRENNEMKNDSREYLELLLHPPGAYDADQFIMFYQSFKEIIRETDRVTDSLVVELENQKNRSDYLIRILSDPDLIAAGSNNHFNSDKNELSCIPVNSAELAAVYLSRIKHNDVQTAIVIDFPIYLKSISEKLIKELYPGSSINVKVEDESGKLIFSKVLKEETSYLSFPFPDHLPPWKIILSENKPGFIATLFKAGSGIYLFIFILIALLMVLGFVFIMYTLNVELRLNKLKSEFISNVSHELKSPLTSIRMMTEMLHNNRVQTEERKSAYYSAMLEESEHLSHLIDNILDFSRMDDDRKKYDFTDVNLDELFTKFLESTREMIPEPGFEIRYDRPENVHVIKADKNAILQVFYNLIDNAIKFSGTSRVIDVNLSQEDNKIVFSVKDYGIGISVKEQGKIFDRFFRGDEPQRSGIRGSGIGLTIVKQIVEAHGGTIAIESVVGKGSRVIARFPTLKNNDISKHS